MVLKERFLKLVFFQGGFKTALFCFALKIRHSYPLESSATINCERKTVKGEQYMVHSLLLTVKKA